jgi:AraC-like DNA-binding protein
MSLAAPSPALVDFVLRHVDIAYRNSSCQRHEGGYALEPRVVADYNLIFVTRGTAVWVVEDKPHDLPPGRLIVVPPGVRHHGFSRTRRVTVLSLHLTAALPGGRDAFDVLIPPRVQTVEGRSPLDRYLRGALGEFDGELARCDYVMPGWCRLVAVELLADNARRGLLTCRDLDPLVAEVLDELARRLSEPTTLDDLAAFTGYSGQHVNRAFKKSLGVTPLQYLMQMRIARAGELLLEGKLTVKAVGEAVGIDDPYYFSRVFKQHVGHSPREHRSRRDSNSPS